MSGVRDEERQVVPEGRRRSRGEAEKLAAEYESSGLSRAEFCQSRRLSLGRLARYRKRPRESGGGSSVGRRWISVEVSGAAGGGDSGLVIALAAERRIEVGRRFDDQRLV